jgi:hypothetical protein
MSKIINIMFDIFVTEGVLGDVNGEINGFLGWCWRVWHTEAVPCYKA